jgi:hypothetical protein
MKTFETFVSNYFALVTRHLFDIFAADLFFPSGAHYASLFLSILLGLYCSWSDQKSNPRNSAASIRRIQPVPRALNTSDTKSGFLRPLYFEFLVRHLGGFRLHVTDEQTL